MSQEFSEPKCYMHRNIGTIAHNQSAMDINKSGKDKIVGLLIEMGYLETIRLLTEEDCLTWWRTKRSLSWTRTCCEEAPQYIWYQEVRTLNEAEYLKDQIADWGRSLELQYQTTAWDVKSTKPSEEGPTVDIWKGYTMRKPLQYKWHWMSRVPHYQMASDMSRIWNILSIALDVESTNLRRTYCEETPPV